MDGITDSTDVSLSKLQQTVKNREAWHAAVHGVAKSHTTEQLNNRNLLELGISPMYNVYTNINRKIRDFMALLKALL